MTDPSSRPRTPRPARAHRLDAVHHVAVQVEDVAGSVAWYRERFRCEVEYEDATWALLRFHNVSVALTVPGEHPPHVGFAHPDAGQFGPLVPHRDGTRSVYVQDPAGNTVELLDADSLPAPKDESA